MRRRPAKPMGFPRVGSSPAPARQLLSRWGLPACFLLFSQASQASKQDLQLNVPTQLALVELESTPLDHSRKVSLFMTYHSAAISDRTHIPCGHMTQVASLPTCAIELNTSSVRAIPRPMTWVAKEKEQGTERQRGRQNSSTFYIVSCRDLS